MGVEYIFVIHLSQEAIIDKEKYPNSKIREIIPSVDLGDALTGTLDFTSDGAAKRIEQGYRDAKRILQPMVEVLQYNADSQRIFTQMKKEMEEFEGKKRILLKKEEKAKYEMKHDGFDQLEINY